MNYRASNSTVLLASAIALSVAPVFAQPLTAVISDPENVEVKLEPIVNLSGFVPIDAATYPGSTDLYVGTYIANSASVQIVDPLTKSVAATPFLTFAGTGVPIDGQGLQGITFSPNFDDDSQPGYRKFYTYEAEDGPGGSNVMFLHPEVSNPGTVGVIREWTANSAGTAIDTGIPSRVVFNFGTPGGHMGGGMKFGPDGYLYLATGDGGGNGNGGSTSNNSDGFTGRNPGGSSNDVPGISNGQDFTNVLGKVIRIDPYVTNADGSPRATPAGSTAKEFDSTTRYFIPGDNPFVGNSQNVYFTPIGPASAQTPVAPLEELFAIGFRNPWKLGFDQNAMPGDAPYVSDVGSHVREEINRVEAGNNYAWPYLEGDIASDAANGRPLVSGNLPYLKQTSPGVYEQFDLDPTFSDPSQMPLPLVRLGTRSVSGGQIWDRPGNDYFNDGIYGDEWGDSNTVTGGFIYRGTAIPELEGMYVFGGYELVVRANMFNYDPESIGGRLFYFDPNLAGDYNNNGVVDAADYVSWRIAFGESISLPNETESLGVVDQDDYDAWIENFGATRGDYPPVYEFNYLSGFDIDANAGGNLLSVAQGSDGELYAMFANGDIKVLAPSPGGDGSAGLAHTPGVPEPTSLLMVLVCSLGMLGIRRRADGGRPS